LRQVELELNSLNYGLYCEHNDDKAVRAEQWKGNSIFF